MTDEEAHRLWRYVQGGRFSGAARRMLYEFSDEKGWSDEELAEAISEVHSRFGSEASPLGTGATTSGLTRLT
jgi:hypothetical protein